MVGKTVQGREMLLLTITDERAPDAQKKVLWLMFRQHSWEAFSCAPFLYFSSFLFHVFHYYLVAVGRIAPFDVLAPQLFCQRLYRPQ